MNDPEHVWRRWICVLPIGDQRDLRSASTCAEHTSLSASWVGGTQSIYVPRMACCQKELG